MKRQDPTGTDVTMNPHVLSRGRQVRANFFRAWSLKAGGRLVALESELELRALLMLEADPAIVALCERPVRIDHLASSGRQYTFDLGTRNRDGFECLIEVAPASRLMLCADGLMKPRHWDEIEDWCQRNGHHCRCITDADLSPHELLINNWRRILPLVREGEEHPEPDIRAELLCLGCQPDGISLTDAAIAIGDASRQRVFAQAFWLLHQGGLEADLCEAPADANLVIRASIHDQ